VLQAGGGGGGGHDQVVEALEAARRRAEWEKHEKWLRKLEAGNHDTSKLRANFESMYVLCPSFCENVVHQDSMLCLVSCLD